MQVPQPIPHIQSLSERGTEGACETGTDGLVSGPVQCVWGMMRLKAPAEMIVDSVYDGRVPHRTTRIVDTCIDRTTRS